MFISATLLWCIRCYRVRVMVVFVLRQVGAGEGHIIYLICPSVGPFTSSCARGPYAYQYTLLIELTSNMFYWPFEWPFRSPGRRRWQLRDDGDLHPDRHLHSVLDLSHRHLRLPLLRAHHHPRSPVYLLSGHEHASSPRRRTGPRPWGRQGLHQPRGEFPRNAWQELRCPHEEGEYLCR